MENNGQSDIFAFFCVFHSLWQINLTASWPTVGGGTYPLFRQNQQSRIRYCPLVPKCFWFVCFGVWHLCSKYLFKIWTMLWTLAYKKWNSTYKKWESDSTATESWSGCCSLCDLFSGGKVVSEDIGHRYKPSCQGSPIGIDTLVRDLFGKTFRRSNFVEFNFGTNLPT